MKALMLHSENSAVGLYRIWQPAKWLKTLGWETATTADELHNMKIDGSDGMEGLGKGSDIIVVQRPENVENIALFMAMRDHFNAPFVFEIDDNIYDVAESSISYQYWYPGSPRILVVEALLREADAVTVTTENLKKLYSRFNDNIFVIPNMQDPELWENVTKKKSKHFTIGWAGSATHYDDLKMIWRPIKKFLRNHKDARFKVVGANCDFLDGHPQVEIVTKFAGIRDYPQYLANLAFDVGIIPVVNRDFNLGKSNIKWQEYSMAGIPTIASGIGEYKEIEHGVTGLLANDDTTWEYNLEKLYDNKNLREELSSNAKQYTLKNLNIKNRIGEYDRVYRNIIRKYKSS